MKRFPTYLACLLAAGAMSAAASPARAGTSFDIQLRIGDRYPGTDIVFRDEPDVVMIPRTRVYYVSDYEYDMYRYGSYWYYCDGMNWYRARSYRGPFYFIHYRTVPRPIYSVPVRYRRHWRDWSPGNRYGHFKADRGRVIREYRDYDRRDDRGDRDRRDRGDRRRDDRRRNRYN